MCKLKFLYERSKLNSMIEFTSDSMEMRIEDDEVCLNNLVLGNFYKSGKSQIQRDVMCSFRKRAKANPEDPEAQYKISQYGAVHKRLRQLERGGAAYC